MQLLYIFRGLELGPLAIERVVARIPESEYDRKTDPDRFSPREAVAHLADWEPILLNRLRSAVETPGGTVPGIDESQRAIDGGYASRDPREEARKLVELRAETVAYLRSLAPEDWEKTFVHAERGAHSVFEAAAQIVGHDTYHLEHLSQYL